MTATLQDDYSISPSSDKKDGGNYKMQIVWRNIFLMTFLHVGGLYGYFYVGLSRILPWWSILIPDIIARLGAMGITAGAHRLWAHRSYKAKFSLRVVLMILQTLALQDDIYQWARDHRLHHKHSDTDADPYNAQRGFFFSHIGWLLVRKHPEVIKKGKTIPLDDLLDDPIVRFQRKYYVPLVLLIWGFLPTYGFHYLTGLSVWESFAGVVLFRYLMSLHYSWLVNSAAHLYGMQMYDGKLHPRENRFVNYSTFGEGYHNYHHAFPYDYSASELGWEKNFNLSTMLIDACAFVGLATDLRKVDRATVEKRVERAGNPIEREKYILNVNIFIDYALGFFFSYFVTMSMYAFRYYNLGHF